MAVIQIKRRTTAGSGPLVGSSGKIYQAEPQVDTDAGKLFIAKATKVASAGTQITEADYIEFLSTPKIQALVTTALIGLNLGSVSTKNTGTGSGNVPILDSSGKLSDSIIPKIAITNTFVVSSQATMLGLSTAQEGDVAVRTDIKKTYILKATPSSTLANWQILESPTDVVTSVNGSTGAVTISLAALGGISTGTFSSHVGSNLHLNQTQRDIIDSVRRIENEESLGHVIVGNEDFEHDAIQYGILLNQVIDTSGTVPTIKHKWGVNKNMVLTPQSVINGGFF
jgi:hypothetical protein